MPRCHQPDVVPDVRFVFLIVATIQSILNVFLLDPIDMVNIFEQFLPQLLRYPNPTDPLNGEAANLMMRDTKQYEAKVKGLYPVSAFSENWGI